MKITYIGHASVLVEAGGIAILSDPWWRGPCFGAQWWNYPLPCVSAIEDCQIDYIYVSHGHHDHLHPGTLRTLSKHAKVLVSAKTELASSIRELGFDVIEMNDGQIVTLGSLGVSCCIMNTHGGDTLMTISDGTEVCVNLNDALHSAPDAVQRDFIERLKAIHSRIDYAFCGYGGASHFPNCYVIPGKNREATAARRQQHFNRQWARIIAELQPVYGFPFAADVVFLEDDLFWVNEVTHNAERPTAAFRALYPDSQVITKDIAPGFVIENGTVTNEMLRQPVLAADLRTICAEQIGRANRHGTVDEQAIKEVANLLQGNLDACAEYLSSYDRDYRFLIRFRNSELGIHIEKRGQSLSLAPTRATSDQGYEVAFTTRIPYLKWTLTRQYGDEILFVGSGGIFEYFQCAKTKTNLHRELIHLLRKNAPPPVTAKHSRIVYKAKQLIKRVLGRTDVDLYDLNAWTVYHDGQA